MKLYKVVELPSDEPVQFVGVYVLNWGQVSEPAIGFVEASTEEIVNAGIELRYVPVREDKAK